ncbi:MAG: hypothetical protein HQL52_03875 [Magnetococcales bacterium]|nr:hypothetical protein [Magnetococcales bacterium]
MSDAKPQPDDLAARLIQLQLREQAVAAREQQLQEDGILAFVEGLIREGKAAPKHRQRLVQLITATDELGGTLAFSELDGEEITATPGKALRDLLADAPPVVHFAEVAAEERGLQSTAFFKTPAGYTVDPEGLKLHSRALHLMQKTPGLAYAEAANQAAK